MTLGLHGTSLWAARRILAHGWDAGSAEALATPRMMTGPEMVYAMWLDEYELERAMWAAREWAREAAERAVITPAGRRMRGAVLLIEADELVMPYAERVARSEDARVLGVVSIGRGLACACEMCTDTGMPLHEDGWRWRDITWRMPGVDA